MATAKEKSKKESKKKMESGSMFLILTNKAIKKQSQSGMICLELFVMRKTFWNF